MNGVSRIRKIEIVWIVEQSQLPAKRSLDQLGIAHRTFYRWYDRYIEGGPEALEDRPSTPIRVGSRIGDDIQQQIIELALDYTIPAQRRQDFKALSPSDTSTSTLQPPECEQIRAKIALVSPDLSTQALTIRVTRKGSSSACMDGDEGNLAGVLRHLIHVVIWRSAFRCGRSMS